MTSHSKITWTSFADRLVDQWGSRKDVVCWVLTVKRFSCKVLS